MGETTGYQIARQALSSMKAHPAFSAANARAIVLFRDDSGKTALSAGFADDHETVRMLLSAARYFAERSGMQITVFDGTAFTYN